MTIDPRRIEVMSDEKAEMMRQLAPAEKLILSGFMWRIVRGRTLRLIRREHPDWTWLQIRNEANQRMWWDQTWFDHFDEDAMQRDVFKRRVQIFERNAREAKPMCLPG